MSNYIKNIISTFNRQLLSLILGIFTAAIIARYLGVENRGVYALILLLPTTIFTFLNLGINSAIVYFIGKKNNNIKDIIQSIKLISIVLITISTIIGFIIILFYKNIFFKDVNEIYLFLALFFIPSLIYTNFLQAIFIGYENFKTINYILILHPIIFLFLLTLNLFFDFKLEGVLIAELLTHYIILFITHYYIKKLYHKNKGNASKELIYSKLKYGFKNHIANMISFFEYRLDLFMVTYYLDLKSVGAYVIAVNIAEKIWMVASSVSSVMFARIANLTDKKEKASITIYSAKVVFIVSSIIGIVLYFVSGKLIILLFGQEYNMSILPFLYLLPGIVFWSVVKVYASYIAGEGKPEYNIYVSVISVILNFIFNIILIPEYGLSGAAIATSIAYITNFILRLLVFQRMSKVSLFNIILPTRKELNILLTYIKNKGCTK